MLKKKWKNITKLRDMVGLIQIFLTLSETGALLKDSSDGVKPEKSDFSCIIKFVMNNLYLSVFTDLINKSSDRYP